MSESITSSASVADTNTGNTSQPGQVDESTSNVSDESGVDSGSDAAAQLADVAKNGTPQQKVEAKKMLKQLRLKIDGQEYDEQLPFEIPDDEKSREWMTRHLQKAKGADKRFQESKQLEDQVKQFVQSLQNDPKSVLAQIGIDPEEFATSFIEEKLKRSQMSPEQLEKIELQEKLKKLEEESKKKEEEYTNREKERLFKQERERIDLQMGQAIEKSDLPKSPYVVKKMAEYMMAGLANGLDVTPDDVLPLVREDIMKDVQQMFSLMPEDVIESVVGKEVFNKVRKRNVAKAKAATPTNIRSQIQDTGKSSQSTAEKPKPKLSMKEFFKF